MVLSDLVTRFPHVGLAPYVWRAFAERPLTGEPSTFDDNIRYYRRPSVLDGLRVFLRTIRTRIGNGIAYTVTTYTGEVEPVRDVLAVCAEEGFPISVVRGGRPEPSGPPCLAGLLREDRRVAELVGKGPLSEKQRMDLWELGEYFHAKSDAWTSMLVARKFMELGPVGNELGTVALNHHLWGDDVQAVTWLEVWREMMPTQRVRAELSLGLIFMLFHKAACRDPEQAEACFVRALVALPALTLSASETAYEEAVVLNGLAFLRMSHDLDEASRLVQRSLMLLEQAASHPKAEAFSSVAQDNLGFIALAKGAPATALDLFEAAIAKNGSFYRYHHHAGRAAMALHRYELASHYFARATRLDPARRDLRLDLIDSYEEQGKLEYALREIEDCIALFGEHASLKIRAALCLLELERPAEARETLLSLDPQSLEDEEREILERLLACAPKVAT